MWSIGEIFYTTLVGFSSFYGDFVAKVFEAVLKGNMRFPTTIFRLVIW